jgi:DNA replication protein DnaC
MTTTTASTIDSAAAAAVEAATRELHLPAIREHAVRLATQAQRAKATYLGYLADTLSVEVDERAERRRRRLVHEARFPRIKRLAEFDFDAAPTINPATIATLAAGGYLDAGDPIVLLGDSGTGKTHLMIALGIAACEQARRVRYGTCAQLVNELVEAADERRVARLIARYSRVDLLCVDELGYVKLDTRSAELLFQTLTERDERASIAVASNLSFSEWGSIITDPRLVAAVIDRVTFNAHIIETGTDSYRLRTSRTRVTADRRRHGPRATPTPRPRGGAKHVSTGGANPT